MSMSHPVFEHFHLTEYPSRWHTGTVRIKGIDACVCPQMRVCTTIRARAPITASIHLRNRYSSKINILHNFDNFTNDIRMTLITARSSCCWKVKFSQACVIHSVHGEGGCIPACLSYTTLAYPPGHTPTTVNKRAVSILLECFLVLHIS